MSREAGEAEFITLIKKGDNRNSMSIVPTSGRAMKRGLVLAGGGAKGAYEFGCMKVFKASGLEFHAVAGTSVGALNAALWSTGQMQKGADLWQNLEPSRVYPYKPLGRIAQFFIGPATFARGWISDSTTKLAPEPSKWMESIFAWLLVICWLPAIHYTVWAETGSLVAAVFQDVLAFLAFGIGPRWPWFRRLVVMVSIPMGIVWTKDVIRQSFSHHALRFGSVPDTLMGGFSLFLVVTILLARLGAVRSTKPLRNSLEQVMNAGPLEIATYVTTGEEREFTDPDDVQFYELYIPGAPVRPVMQESKKTYFPVYHRLDEALNNDKIDLLLASAALPFGIVPSINVQGHRFVDGGTVDNIPVYPLIEYENCSELVVIRLDHLDKNPGPGDDYMREWQRIDRLLRIRDIEAFTIDSRNPPSPRKNDPPVAVPYEQPTKWPNRIVTLSPSEHLGGFLDGTLNFTREYAQRLIELGERDAREFIAKYWPDLTV